MEPKKKRMQRVTLHGWWKNIPFLVLPVGLLMSFAYLENSLLQNQYEQSEVTRYLQGLSKEIDYLRANDRSLTRIEVMEGQSSNWKLREPDPHQVISLAPIAVETAYAKLSQHRSEHSVAQLPTRTMMLHVDYENSPAPTHDYLPFISDLLSGGWAYGQEEGD